MATVPTVTRFAPSPNGPLHLGHAYSAIAAFDRAEADAGRMVLRIEDIDGGRSRPELADEFRRDLEWLGLEWDETPAQSSRLERYAEAAASLLDRGLLYPCTCTRKQIAAAKPRNGPHGPVYPGTCKGRDVVPGKTSALRLDMDRALGEAGDLDWADELQGEFIAEPHDFGDIVIVRKDDPASYHLAVTLDDAADGVTIVTRGADLFASTHIHRLLQDLLGLPVPVWRHHDLLVEPGGDKLAKSRASGELGHGLTARRLAGDDGRALADALRRGSFPAGISLAKP